MLRILHILAMGGVLLGGAAGCRTTGGGQPVSFISPPVLKANPNPAVPLAAVLTFAVEDPVVTRVEIDSGGSVRKMVFGPDRTPEKGLPLVGFRAGARHDVWVSILPRGRRRASFRTKLEFDAPPLPDGAAEFPVIQVRRTRGVTMEPGVTLFNPRRRAPARRMTPAQAKRFNQGFGMLTAVDETGNVIWYYRGNSRISDFEFLRNGNIIFLTQDFRAVEIDLLGNTVAQWYGKNRPGGPVADATPVDCLTFHHDIDQLANGNFLVLSSERRLIRNYWTSEIDSNAPRKDQWVMGDEVVEFRRDGTVVRRWNAFDHMDPYRIGYETFSGYWKRRGFPDTIDWSHANSLVPLPDGSFLINYRYQSAILKVRPDGQVAWVAGEPSGWSGKLRKRLLKMEGAAPWFWHQHGPSITPDGTLLLFDNGNFQSRPFAEPVPPGRTRSRMAEYHLDEKKMTLKQRWSSVIPGDPPVVSFAMGSAQVLPRTGNILAGYGFLLSQEEIQDKTWHNLLQSRIWTRVREYTHTLPAQIAWEMAIRARPNELDLGWSLFGSRRVPDFPPAATERR